MSEIIFFDTCVLSDYFVKEKFGILQEDYQIVSSLFQELKTQNATLCISSLVVSELLFAFGDDSEREEVLQMLLSTFEIASYDVHCATLAVKLLDEGDYFKTYKDLQTKERKIVKEDQKILATAINKNATRFYTYNIDDFNKYSGNRLKIISPKKLPLQFDLLEDNS